MLKLYILVRKDAPLGKVMAHVGHVCCNVMRYLEYDAQGWSKDLEDWQDKYDQTKIILQVKDRNELEKWIDILGKDNCILEFETQIDIHTKERYCLAVGPLTDEEAKDIGLKKLSLYK